MIHRRTALTVGALALAGVVAIFGVVMLSTVSIKAHDVSLIKKTITIEMSEFSYTVDGVANGTVTLKVGETASLIFINKGAVIHDAHFGLDADLMGRFYKNNIVAPFDMLVLEAGEKATLTFTPEKAGTFEMGCLQPAHFEAGMKVPFVVAP